MERHTEIEHVLRPDLFWDCMQYKVVWRVRNQTAHRDAWEGNSKGKMRMEWVASSLAMCIGKWSIQHYYQH